MKGEMIESKETNGNTGHIPVWYKQLIQYKLSTARYTRNNKNQTSGIEVYLILNNCWELKSAKRLGSI